MTSFKSPTHWLLKASVKKKQQELIKKGYPEVTEEDIFSYLYTLRWKHETPKSLKQKQEDILLVTENDFFDYLQWTMMKKETFEELDYLL